jgi:hypothetical protein
VAPPAPPGPLGWGVAPDEEPPDAVPPEAVPTPAGMPVKVSPDFLSLLPQPEMKTANVAKVTTAHSDRIA